MKRILCALVALLSPCVYAQTTPSLQLNLPAYSSPGWAQKLNANFTLLDQYLSGARPLQKVTLSGAITSPTQAATKAYVDAAVVGGCGICITSLTGDVTASGGGAAAGTVRGINGVVLSSLSTGLLKVTAGVPSIGVAGTDFLSPTRNLSDLQSATIARTNLGLGTAATQASSAFDVSGAAATAQAAAQAFAANASNISSGTIGAARVPVLNQNTTGNAATATALAGTPTLCSAGQAAGGILASGNATGCFTPAGGGSMVYPGAGIANSTGTTWGTSFSVGNTGSSIPQLSSGFLSASIIPTLNQNTTGNAATATALASTPAQCSGNNFAKGITSAGTANCALPPQGTLTNFTAGSLSPLFSTSVATAGTTPVLSFTQATAAANTVFGNFNGTSGAPTFSNSPVFSAASLTNFPILNQNTTGTASGLSGSQTANTVYAAPNGSAGTAAFRALVAGDIPSLPYQAPITLTTTGTSGSATLIGNTLNIPQYAGGGSMVYPAGSGIPVVAGGTSWGTTLAAPVSTIVGISDTQTITNKNIAASQLTGSSLPLTFTTAGGLTTVAGGTFGTAAFTASSAYDAAGAASAAQTAATAAFTGDVVKTSGSFATTVTRINGTSLAGLSTGLLKNTITTGVPSIAVAGTDYQAPISLTNTGTSGLATFSGNVLNIPNYTYTLPQATTSVLGGMKPDGTSITCTAGVCSATTGGSGTVTAFSSGNLSPLFTTSVATSTTTPALTFALANAAQNSVLAGPATGGAGSPSYQTAPTISAANMTGFPTFNQNTTGTAAGIAGGAVGSLPYQSASGTTSFITSPTTTGHTFVPAWQPSGSAIAPASLDLATYLASPPSIGSVTPGSGAFTTLSSTSAVSIGSSVPTACGSATGCMAFNEASTAGTPTAAMDYIRADSTSHTLKFSVNGGAEVSIGASAVNSLTTTGTSGAATLSGGILNIPNYTYTLPTASTSTLGGVKVDGTSITITAGVISSAGGSGNVSNSGTPSSGQMATWTSSTVIQGVSMGSGVQTWITTPSSANLASAITDETGSGSAVFATSPTLVTPNIGAATGTSLLATGNIDGKAPTTVTTTTPVTLGGTFKSGYTWNAEATAATAVTYNLPAAATGLQYCVGNSWNGSASTTGVLTVVAAASNTIIFTDGTLSTTAGNVTSGGAAADMACFIGVDGSHWQMQTIRGSWAKH